MCEMCDSKANHTQLFVTTTLHLQENKNILKLPEISRSASAQRDVESAIIDTL